jgi:hypothetical protein
LVGHVEQMEEVRYAYKTLIGNMKWKKGFWIMNMRTDKSAYCCI